MNIVWAYITLIRAHNCLVAMLAVAVGHYLTLSVAGFRPDPYAMAVAFFVCAFGNIINDIHDIESDRINHPRRALPSETLSLAQARTLAFFFLLISTLLMVCLTGVGMLIVLVSLFLVSWYNLSLKHMAYWGNLAVSILGGLTIMLGGAAGGYKAMLSLPGPLIPAVFAFLMHFGREIIKDIEDRAGDEITGGRTGPIISGIKQSLRISFLLFVLLIVLSIVVYWIDWFDDTFLYIVVISIYIPLICQFIWLNGNPSRRNCRIVSVLLKFQMLMGLAALVLGKNY